MIAWVLIVVMGAGRSTTSLAINGIESEAQCRRLASFVQRDYGSEWVPARTRCYAYRASAALTDRKHKEAGK